MSTPATPEVDDRGRDATAVALPDTGPRAGVSGGWGRARLRRLMTYAAFVGPGLVAANAGNDAGGIATYASAGSQFVYRSLFFMLLVTVGLVVVQEMSARLGTFTGKGLGALIREEFSIRLATFAVASLVVANLGIVVTEFAGIGAAFELFGVSRYITVPLAAIVIWALVLFGSYRYAERIFLLMSLVFVAYPVAAVLGHPPWRTVGSHLVVPHLVASQSFLFLAVALIGTTISPYMQLYAASAVVDRGIGPDEYHLERVDAVAGAIFAPLVAMFIIVATAAAIGGYGPLDSAAQAARALRPVAGSGATVLFGIGLLGASALAAAVVPLSTAYAVSEAVGAERSVSRKFSEAPLMLGFFTAQVVIGSAVALIPVNLFKLLVFSQMLQGLITPVFLSFVLVLANRRSLLGDAANGRTFRKVALATVLAVTAMCLLLLGQTVRGWLGL